MVKQLSTLFLLASLLFLSAGCPRKADPNPSDTMLGGGLSGRQGNMYVPGNLNSGAPLGDPLSDPSQGLFPQEGSLANGNQVEGLLPSIYFDFDQSFIRPDQRDALMQALEYLQSNPADRLLVRGHCDYLGTTEYNIALGDRRSNSVKTFLVQAGIADTRVDTLSRGDLEAVENATDDLRAKDRRADLIVLKP